MGISAPGKTQATLADLKIGDQVAVFYRQEESTLIAERVAPAGNGSDRRGGR